ncbi:MAG: hypothetical protein WBE92_05240 [Steroidobacteraceae bacterium]
MKEPESAGDGYRRLTANPVPEPTPRPAEGKKIISAKHLVTTTFRNPRGER